MKIFLFTLIFNGPLWFSTCFGYTMSSEHRTKAAAEKLNDLWCYKCDTMEYGKRCIKVNTTGLNSTSFHNKCHSDQRICKVTKISISYHGEDIKPRLWLLQRNCTKTCEEGCIVIGERTKIHSCTSCCEKDFCNVGSGSKNMLLIKNNHIIFLIIFVYFYESFIK